MLQIIFLSKVLGIFLVIVGATILFRRHYFIAVFAAFVRERLTRTVISLVELLAGLFLAMHNEWSSFPGAIITIVGWMAVAEGAAYLVLSDELIEKFFRTFNTPPWYVIGGLLAVAVGVYLAGYGFGFIAAGAG